MGVLFSKMFEFLFGKKSAISNGLGVYVKTNTGDTVYIELDPKWDIGNVKSIVSKKIGIDINELKIIFAGKELQDNVTIKECDLGQQSVLHAVKTRRRIPKHLLTGSSSPIEETIRERQDSLASDGFKSISESLLEHEIENATDLPESNASGSSSSPTTKAHFYVYCSTCEKLAPGKLRVRCSICHGGAFTVHRDPENWDDVLRAHRIRGHCECSEVPCVDSDGGQPPFAEFYFKCAEHPSGGEKDFSAPLSLIKTNIHAIPCLACFSVEDLVLVFPCASGHVTCLDCFRNYLTSKLLERNFLRDAEIGYTVGCPVGCEHSAVEDVHHFRLLPKADYDRYQRFATEEFVLQSGGVLCPQPGCGMGILLEEEGDDPPDPECTRVTCQNGCGYVFCRNCLQGAHLGDCLTEEEQMNNSASGGGDQPGGSTYRIDLNRVADSSYEASKTTIRILTKPCPKCRTPTERAGGCMHMVCTRAGCSFEWCWICQIKWSTDCMGAHWFG